MYVSLLINATTVGTISVQRLGLGLGKYEAAFRENEIDETVLPDLTAEDLKEFGGSGMQGAARAINGGRR